MGSLSNHGAEIPKINFTGLRPSLAGGKQWQSVRKEVAAAVHSHGCFEAIYPALSPELREEMFGGAMPELFSLPPETKQRLISDEPFNGYICQLPHRAFQSFAIKDVSSPASVQGFGRLMWPEGNSAFCDTLVAFEKPLRELMNAVQKMILESLGVEKHHDSLLSSVSYELRLAEYGVPLDQETNIALDAHTDPNMLTVICQHEVDGLEVLTAFGSWINVPPSTTSVTFMAGLSFQAWSNGRVRAPWHRVRMPGKEKRFSAVYGTRPSLNFVLKIPDELRDCDGDGRPFLYKPFNYTEFLEFLDSRSGRINGDEFDAYCRIP